MASPANICLFPNGLPPPGARARFDGATYSAADDDVRLTGQLLRIKGLMGDGKWRTVSEISAITGDPEPSVSAQLRHLRKPRFGAWDVQRRKRDGCKALYEYRLGVPGAASTTNRSGYIAKLRAELDAAHARIAELEARLGARQ